MSTHQSLSTDYIVQFLEMILQLTADHGPAVSGAHNCIITARAGKDLVSSLVRRAPLTPPPTAYYCILTSLIPCARSGLLTIGPRFGGAIDGAVVMFSDALDKGLSPQERQVAIYDCNYEGVK